MKKLLLAGMAVAALGLALGSSPAIAWDCPTSGCAEGKIWELVVGQGNAYIQLDGLPAVCVDPKTKQRPLDWDGSAAILNPNILGADGFRHTLSVLLAAKLAGKPVILSTTYELSTDNPKGRCWLNAVTLR